MNKYVLFIIAFIIPFSGMALINAMPLEDNAFPDLVRLVFKDGSMRSGTYLDEYTILTAAHCLSKTQDEQFHGIEKILSIHDEPISVDHLKNVSFPSYHHRWWPADDIGIIKTSKNSKFHGDFKLEKNSLPVFGEAHFYGCGISEFSPKIRSRSDGRNHYVRIGSVLIFIGKSKNTDTERGISTSIAPNDSGAPVTDPSTGKIIAIATQASAQESAEHGIPAISVSTSITRSAVREFILKNMGPIFEVRI